MRKKVSHFGGQHFDVDSYLSEAEESFSGFDGYEDEYDMYEDDVWDDSDDDYAMASGGGVSAKSPSPYQVTVTNTTAGSLNLVLFGNNQFLQSTNFGSDAGLTVVPAQSNVSYLELLLQSASQPFETSLIRVQSSNATQVTQILTVTVKDANGQSASIPIITQSYFSAYQEQSGILDIPYALKIDGNTNIQSTILASATVTYTFFPAEKVNVSKGLAGKTPVQQYGRPQVNMGGMKFPSRSGQRVLGQSRRKAIGG